MTPSPFQPVRSGKVRDIYDADGNYIIVSSDRISAFDCVLPTPIPDKGKILNTLSVFWFARTGHIIDNHLILHRVSDYPQPFNSLNDELEGRSMLVRRAQIIPVECVVRGYLAGSGWQEYQKSQSVCGIPLPKGLRESDALPCPIFTPTTKADVGHDEPIDFDGVIRIVGLERAMQLRDVSLALYKFAADFACDRGVIIADTKFEFGTIEDELVLVDEMCTPDSSRFWDLSEYSPGRTQNSFDKQFVRDYLSGLDWDKTPPAPALPDDIIQRTAPKYQEAYYRLTGRRWPDTDVRAA
jgi:phosphoribosylaminoimidazole-succinocarboxamide synthase